MDKIVSTVYFEGEVYIFTEQGHVYKMYKHEIVGIAFQRVTSLKLNP